MASQKNFAIMPNVSITRSKFVRPFTHKTSFNLGEIIPLYIDEVLPGDSRSISIADLTRMSNVIAPIMDNIKLDFYAFYCPNRLLWSHWKEFMGENTDTAGAQDPTEYSIPTGSVGDDVAGELVGTLGDYFGILGGVQDNGNVPEKYVSELPLRMYYLVYNRWFRDQNIIDPIPVDIGDNANSDITYNDFPLKAAKFSDYFTRSLPYAQKGNPVNLPLGTTAPVLIASTKDIDGSADHVYNPVFLPSSKMVSTSGLIDQDITGTATMFADLTKATAATINDLRFAFQYQKLLEKDALYGTRYWEILKAHFGVDAPDASLQDPEYLGHFGHYININEVTQTTGKADDSTNTLGQVAAKSVTGGSGHLFNKSFVEHGYIMILAVARHDQTYTTGINRMWFRKTRTDFYMPVFANLGAQSVLNKEIYCEGGSSANDNKVFGFQEAWAEYRYKPSMATGLLNPVVPNSLGYWTLANNFAALPTLSQSFIEQDRDNIARALSSGVNGPDFIIDFMVKDIAVRPMPLYSIPGLIDHH